MQKKSCSLGRPLNFDTFPKIEEIFRKLLEIMGKYRIWHENLWGLKGLMTGPGPYVQDLHLNGADCIILLHVTNQNGHKCFDGNIQSNMEKKIGVDATLTFDP